jgi:hypothetical protein
MIRLSKYLCKFNIIKHTMVVEAIGLRQRYLVCERCNGNRLRLLGDERI